MERRSMSLSVSPDRVLNFFPSGPRTSPKGTWSTRVVRGSRIPASLAASKII